MILASLRWLSSSAAGLSVVLLALLGPLAHGQSGYPAAGPGTVSPYAAAPAAPSRGVYPSQYPSQPYIPPYPCVPGTPAPVPEGLGQPGLQGQQGQPGEQGQAGQQRSPSEGQQQARDPGLDLSGQTPMDGANADLGQGSSLPSEQGAGGGGNALALAAPGGYLDNPIPITTFRLRYDAAWNLNRPDRAEYYYAAWRGLGSAPHGIQNGGAFLDRTAKGPSLLPGNIDYQQPEGYLEVAFRNTFSAFVQAPYRFARFRDLEPTGTEPATGGTLETTPSGFADLQFGFKSALLASPTQFLTLQVRAYSPTGSPSQGMGTGHWSVEPSLLYYQRFNRLVLQGQMTDWTPIHGGLAGNILEYGGGLGYAIYQRGSFAVMPITEMIGWTILNGYETVPGPITATAPFPLPASPGVANADGETIINAKFGVRTFWGNGNSLYVGYGRALTGTHWYTDIFRLEYRVFFGALRGTARPL